MPTRASDSVIRAISDDGAFRVITIATTNTVRGASLAQSASPALAPHFADLLTGTILVRETMAPGLRVQGILKGQGGRGALIADSNPDGTTRGLIQVRPIASDPSSAFALGPGSLLQIMRTLPSGRIHQGIVDVSSAQGLSQALMTYLQESEQIVSVIAVGTIVEHDVLERAGGYIVQLLPEASRAVQMIMAERLDALPSIETFLGDPSFSPQGLLDELLHGMPYGALGESPLRFECRCSVERVMTSLATLGRADLAELASSDESLEISCDYCGKAYPISPETLRPLTELPS
jgi:molecular chaperone Hsp33